MFKLLMSAALLTALATPAMAEVFPKLVVKSFVQGCSEDDEAMTRYCQCTIDEMQKRMSVAEFEAVIELPEDEMMEDEHFSDSIVACLDHIPE
jgi:hypothetical protein